MEKKKKILLIIIFVLALIIGGILLKEYNDRIGKSPIEDTNDSYEDNKMLSKSAYIQTNNPKVDEIFNKMLDSIVEKHTMEIKENDQVIRKVDFITSISMSCNANGANGYIEFCEKYSQRYIPRGDSYEIEDEVPRKQMIYLIANFYNWGVVEQLGNKEYNPYSKSSYFDMLDYDCAIEENEENYIIDFHAQKEGETYYENEKYYINKDTYLLEKSESYNSDSNINREYTYEYTEDTVNIPEEVYRKIIIDMPAEKPIIYLYPTEETEVSVKIKYDDKITVSYPKYQDGWNVIAKSNGNLIDLKTNRNLYALYYESESVYEFKVEKDGFVVKSEDVLTFLEEKLEILGLTEREAEEFIIYWLPRLECNKYNYIRFATMDEINKNMPLEINPNPDSIIRVLMTFKGLDNPIEVKEQKLFTPERTGFVAVEWGGTELK